jgi:hypothetical protein
MILRPQTSQSRSAYLQGFKDRRLGRECRDNEIGPLAPCYLDGWEDGERLPRLPRPVHPPTWLLDLIQEEAA